MTAYLSTELGGSANQTAAPVGYTKPGNERLKRLRASFTLASQASTDTLVIGVLPVGAKFAYGVICTDTSLGSTTVAIGPSSSSAKYRAAAALTSTDTPTLFGKAAPTVADALTADETVIATLGAAAAPASGNLSISIYYSMP